MGVVDDLVFAVSLLLDEAVGVLAVLVFAVSLLLDEAVEVLAVLVFAVLVMVSVVHVGVLTVLVFAVSTFVDARFSVAANAKLKLALETEVTSGTNVGAHTGDWNSVLDRFGMVSFVDDLTVLRLLWNIIFYIVCVSLKSLTMIYHQNP